MTTKKTVKSGVRTTVKNPAAKRPAANKPVTKKAAVRVARVTKRTVDPEQVTHPKKAKKDHKQKVVRDSFTMPHDEYQKVAEIKAICQKAKMHVKKSEVLRAGLRLLAGLTETQLKQAMGSLEKIKTGRPKKH